MRPQNRPFVVEIKKTKRGGAPVAGAAAAPPPATWAEQFEQATALNDSAARKAAEAVFSAPRPASPPVEPASARDVFRRDEPKAPEASGRTGRILLALEPAPAETPDEPDLPADDDREEAEVSPRRRTARQPLNGKAVLNAKSVHSDSAVAADADADREARPARVAAPAKARPLAVASARTTPAPAAPVPVLATPEQPSLTATAAVPARKGAWRRGAATPLARGEKWKRRLPQVLR